MRLGIQPDILLCRCDRPIPPAARKKIALFCNLRESRVIPALDVDTIYGVPAAYHSEGFDREVCRHFALDAPEPDLDRWDEIVNRIRKPEGRVTIAIVGKYTHLPDSYKSLAEAMTHGGIANNVGVNLDWIDSEVFEAEAEAVRQLDGVHGILVPGGFGERGSEGMIEAARFARERRVPYFGVCLGMQMAVIEAARHLANLRGARLERIRSVRASGRRTDDRMDARKYAGAARVERRSRRNDAARRLRGGARAREPGGADLWLHPDQRAASPSLRDQHRLQGHVWSRRDYAFSGMSPDGKLPEIIELPDHPWFIGVQFHPELKVKALRTAPAVHFVRPRGPRPVAVGLRS